MSRKTGPKNPKFTITKDYSDDETPDTSNTIEYTPPKPETGIAASYKRLPTWAKYLLWGSAALGSVYTTAKVMDYNKQKISDFGNYSGRQAYEAFRMTTSAADRARIAAQEAVLMGMQGFGSAIKTGHQVTQEFGREIGRGFKEQAARRGQTPMNVD